MYILEISPERYRGILGGMGQMAITCGILFSNISTIFSTIKIDKDNIKCVDNVCAIRHKNHFIYSQVSIAIPSIIGIIGLCFSPESPRYLYDHEKVEEAKIVIVKYQGYKKSRYMPPSYNIASASNENYLYYELVVDK